MDSNPNTGSVASITGIISSAVALVALIAYLASILVWLTTTANVFDAELVDATTVFQISLIALSILGVASTLILISKASAIGRFWSFFGVVAVSSIALSALYSFLFVVDEPRFSDASQIILSTGEPSANNPLPIGTDTSTAQGESQTSPDSNVESTSDESVKQDDLRPRKILLDRSGIWNTDFTIGPDNEQKEFTLELPYGALLIVDVFGVTSGSPNFGAEPQASDFDLAIDWSEIDSMPAPDWSEISPYWVDSLSGLVPTGARVIIPAARAGRYTIRVNRNDLLDADSQSYRGRLEVRAFSELINPDNLASVTVNGEAVAHDFGDLTSNSLATAQFLLNIPADLKFSEASCVIVDIAVPYDGLFDTLAFLLLDGAGKEFPVAYNDDFDDEIEYTPPNPPGEFQSVLAFRPLLKSSSNSGVEAYDTAKLLVMPLPLQGAYEGETKFAVSARVEVIKTAAQNNEFCGYVDRID